MDSARFPEEPEPGSVEAPVTSTIASDAPESFLVAAARGGSAAAFRTIVERYHERLYQVVFRIVRNRSDAEEVTQETFLKAFRGLGSFQEDSALFTWLYRIAVNAAVDVSKKQKRRRHLSLNDESSPGEMLDVAVDAGPGDEPERAELVELVRQGIEELPEQYRVILTLREYGELSYEDLASVLHLPKGTVESRLFRARMRLKDWLLRQWQQRGLDPEEFGY